jgi:homoserine/homoserine lactone efflux protein
LITANSIAYGTRFGLLTVAGTSCAMLPQLVVTALGLTAMLGLMAQFFEGLRWAGVIYLGLRAWRARAVDLTRVKAVVKSASSIWLRGFLISLGNPKTLLFYGAFLPQFIMPDRPVLPQIILLSITFLVLAVTVDSGWAVLAGRTRHLLMGRGRLRNRLTGTLMLAAGFGLAITQRR